MQRAGEDLPMAMGASPDADRRGGRHPWGVEGTTLGVVAAELETSRAIARVAGAISRTEPTLAEDSN